MPHDTVSLTPERLAAALAQATDQLLAERAPEGHWTGDLSSSALSTATAVIALAVVERERASSSAPRPEVSTDVHTSPALLRKVAVRKDHSALRTPHSALPRFRTGLSWLAAHRNPDGGWGDTVQSVSNISTTALCWAAFGAVPGADEKYREVVAGAEAWLSKAVATSNSPPLDPSLLAQALTRRYGKDRTFSIPILTACALAGRLGSGAEAWRQVLSLPFELAACPPSWFAALRLPVVSYALPALIAIGLARHVNRPSRNPIARLLRCLTRKRTLRILSEIQPSSGGFLEATPLTSFVVMSLAGSGQAEHPVTLRGLEFLLRSQRPDGSWPIDTNLATWVTTLAVNALPDAALATQSAPLKTFLLSQQFRAIHPYTRAAAGGWAWTHLPGGVPDADDTAGALLTLMRVRSGPCGRPPCGLRNTEPRDCGRLGVRSREEVALGRDGDGQGESAEVESSARLGVEWLLGLQNRDGGIPTFCRGWGTMPFDRSSPDLTAHAMRAWLAWGEPLRLQERVNPALARALGFLERAQHANGCWIPLWFGNQHSPDDENPTYGTARVVIALCEARKQFPAANPMLTRGVEWLLKAQNPDGGWGGNIAVASSVEETALAVEALACACSDRSAIEPDLAASMKTALHAGAAWLVSRVESGAWKQPSPIGFYFAKLWYFEKLYPQIFTVAALAQAATV